MIQRHRQLLVVISEGNPLLWRGLSHPAKTDYKKPRLFELKFPMFGNTVAS